MSTPILNHVQNQGEIGHPTLLSPRRDVTIDEGEYYFAVAPDRNLGGLVYIVRFLPEVAAEEAVGTSTL